MLKKIGLAAAAAIGLSMMATPAFAAPPPAEPEIAAPEIAVPEIAAPEAEAPDMAAPEAEAPDMAAPEGADLAVPPVAAPAQQWQCPAGQVQSLPRPRPIPTIPCSFSWPSWPRPQLLGGGLSALLSACLDLNLNLRLRPHQFGTCSTWRGC